MSLSRFAALLALVLAAPGAYSQDPPARVLDEIRREATLPNRGPAGRPLPLAGHWNSTGMYREGFTGKYQLQLLREGRHLLPWLEWPPTDRDLDSIFRPNDPRRQAYIDGRIKEFEPIVKELARLKLPVSFLATQWESTLTYSKAYFGLPADKNPNVIGVDGKVKPQVCPFGPVEPWREVGRQWTDNHFMKLLQQWYPDPPLVILISNNEHSKQQWNEVEKSQRYMEKYGPGKSDDFKRKVVGDGWIERYGALLEGLRSGLVSPSWQKNVKLVGYEAFPPVHFGRWGGWKDYSLTIPGRLDPQPVVWDGGSPSYYLHNWMALTDYTLWSPQIETMNWVFMLDEIHRTRPDFWFELSTWDGNVPGMANDKRMFYARQGQLFTPERYEGFVQYGMWLTRPRIVRDFRSHTESVEYAGPYFKPILDAIDRVYREPVLEKFWRHGALVVNRRGHHPFQADIPAEYKSAPRWFLLDTTLTPKELKAEEFDNAKPPSRQVEVPVFALALALGTAPQREWLVFANAPRHARLGVGVTVPEYGEITVDIPQSGSFFHVREGSKDVHLVHQGGPATFQVEAPRFVDVDAPATFAVADKYSPSGKLEPAAWDFGDGTKASGDRLTHRFAHAGQYLVSVTGSRAGTELVREQVPVFVGLKPAAGLVCRLLMQGALRDGMKSWIWLSGWDKVDYHFIPDASGAGNFGFLAGGAWVHDDQRGTVLELDGKRDRVEITNSPALNSGGPYRERTIAFWFRAAAADPKRKEQRQVLYEEGGPGAGMNLYLDGTKLYAGAWNQGKGTWLDKDLAPEAWHHVALVLHAAPKEDEATLTLYVDGQQAAQGKAPVLAGHPGDINIGRNGSTLFHDRRPADQPGFYFAGRFGEFRILNRGHAPEEIRALAEGQ